MKMKLELPGTYTFRETNGKILIKGSWISNLSNPLEEYPTRVTYITEGRYDLEKRQSPKFIRHLQKMYEILQ
jgi:hypothetical protein